MREGPGKLLGWAFPGICPPTRDEGKAGMTQPGRFHKTSFNVSQENEEKAENPWTGQEGNSKNSPKT